MNLCSYKPLMRTGSEKLFNTDRQLITVWASLIGYAPCLEWECDQVGRFMAR